MLKPEIAPEPEPLSNVHIASDGTPAGTHITVEDIELLGVLSVTWSVDAHSVSTACIVLEGVNAAVAVDAAEVRVS